MEHTKQEDPEVWCRTYSRNNEARPSTSGKLSRLRMRRSKSHSPNTHSNKSCHPNQQRRSPSCAPSEQTKSYEYRDSENQEDGTSQLYSLNEQTQSLTKQGGKRKKKKGKSQSHDRASVRFMRKVQADNKRITEQISAAHVGSCSEVETSDDVDRNQHQAALPESTSYLESSKVTPVMACNIQPETGKIHKCHPPCCTSVCRAGVCGLGPAMTHDAYVFHWLQQQTNHQRSQPQNPQFGPSLVRCQASPCHQSSIGATPTGICYPTHSPLHQLQPPCSGCLCGVTSDQHDMANELMTMIQQEAVDSNLHPMSCQSRSQIPLAPDAQSFLAMLQNRPEANIPSTPCNHCLTNSPSSREVLGKGPCLHTNQTRSTFGPTSSSQCLPTTSPASTSTWTQNGSPCSHCLPSTPKQCSIEHAATFLHHGSPLRRPYSPIKPCQDICSVASPGTPFCRSTPDRSKCDENSRPIGVFWDIENCAVPRGKSALVVVQSIRDRFFANHREAEFMCVCDINKQNATVIQELNDAQVTVAHINATAKNAADDKLKQSLRRFADTHNPPATVVLVSGDINFARDLSDLRHRNNLQVILVHRDEASEALLACANETVRYQDMVQELPFRSPAKAAVESSTLIVHNLPSRKDVTQLRNRLRQLSDNCGGKVVHMSFKNAVIQFPSAENASRAKIRLDGENVFGSKISVAYPKNKQAFYNSPTRSSSQKNTPQSVQDSGEDVSNKEEDECDEKNETDEAQDAHQQEELPAPSASRHTGNIDALKPSYETRPCQSQNDQSDSPKLDPSSLQTSASRIAAAFRPIRHDVGHAEVEMHKPVVEIWPRQTYPDTSTSFLTHGGNSAAPKMKWSSSSLYTQAHNLPVSTQQRPFNDDVRPGLAPFKPIPTVQRIPTPLAGFNSWNRTQCEQTTPSPTLRGIYRPPSPMLANPMGDWQYMSIQDSDSSARKGAELLVTNLDNKMSREELKKCLLVKLKDHCKVLHLIFGSPVPGRYQAVVRVPSIPDAIRAMANINRLQIGTRLLHVSLLLPCDSNADKLRLMMIPMLQEIPGMSLPLNDVKTSFELRYRQMLYVSDLYQIPDTITVRDTALGKVVALTTHSRPNTPNSSGLVSPAVFQSPTPYGFLKQPAPEHCEAFCSIHDNQDSVEYTNMMQDPFVVVSLRTFSAQVHTLLQMHNGKIPLVSFMVCYAAEFPALQEDHDEGVALEHLLTCVQGVRVGVSRDGFKIVCWEQSNPETDGPNGSRSSTPLLPPQLFQFSKEAVELLKHTPRCRLAFSKFIPSYHHHFGRQCRVADYGFLKLIDLFDAISHVLQVLGMTEKKLLTLTHRTQIKRFSQDLLKMLKSQTSKQMTLEEFPQVYHRCFNKPWKVSEYGVCDIQDLLTEVPENMAMISWNGKDTVIFIPKREQTQEELLRMRKFSREVVELLSHQPRSRILFSKFIPTFHHHFGHQCRVGDYGFNKLLELFEALQDVIQVEEHGDERVVSLTIIEQLAVIAARTCDLLQRNPLHLISLETFQHMYARSYMYPICFKDFGTNNMTEIMLKFPHVVEIVSDGDNQRLRLIARKHLSQLAQQLLVVLLEADQGKLPIKKVQQAYQHLWHRDLTPIEYGHSRILSLMKTLHYVLTVHNEWMDQCYIELTPVHEFARRARNVLIGENRLSMTFQELVTKYHRLHGMELQPADYGHTTLTSLIDMVPRVLSIANRGAKRAVTLNPSCLVPTRSSNSRQLSTAALSTNKDTAPDMQSSSHPCMISSESSRSQSISVDIIKPTAQGLGTSAYNSSTSSTLDRPVDASAISSSGVVLEPSCSSEQSDLETEKNTPATKSTSDSEDAAQSTPPDEPKTPKRSGNRYRGRCQLAANFSGKGTLELHR